MYNDLQEWNGGIKQKQNYFKQKLEKIGKDWKINLETDILEQKNQPMSESCNDKKAICTIFEMKYRSGITGVKKRTKYYTNRYKEKN